MVGGASPALAAAARAAEMISSSAAGSSRACAAAPSREAEIVTKQAPRAKALPSRARASPSTRSKPGGRRSRRSSPLALTHLISTVQRHGPSAPAARAKPVMLVSDIAKAPRIGRLRECESRRAPPL